MRASLLLHATTSALLATSAAAIPSFGLAQTPPHHHVAPQSDIEHHSLWRSFSDRLIRKIWRLDGHDRTNALGDAPAKTKPAPAQFARHGGDIVLRFNITTAAEASSLAEAADTLILDVWEYTDDWVDIRLATDIVPSLLGLLPASLQHAHTPILQERGLVQAIADTYPSPRDDAHPLQSPQYHGFAPHISSAQTEGNLFFSDYQPWSVIQPWMRLLASLFTTHVRLINVGVSYEGRDIPALRVGVHPTNGDAPTRRKTILVTGGVHAREWISTSTVNYLAYSLVTGYGKHSSITALLEGFDWIFVPTFNPDGYLYTWETDRLWRKNRQQTHLRFCRGLDLDRSFSFEWDGESTRSNPCSESFAGDSPFEGVEAKSLADWARNETENNNVDFVGFLDLHSYSQQILYPYSYSCDSSPPSLENLQELAAGLAKSIRSSGGHNYQVAPACEGNVAVSNNGDRKLFPRFESGGGSALDWFYHELGVRHAYQIKLRDRGSYGFLLPKEHIVPTGKEMLDAVMHFGKYVSGQFKILDEEGEDESESENETNEVPASMEEAEPRDVDSFSAVREQEQEPLQTEDDERETMWELRRRRRL